MTIEETNIQLAPPAPIFTLDLGANGGVLAPVNGKELHDWIQTEIQFWSWLPSVSGGHHKNAIDQAYAPLYNTLGQSQQALSYEASSQPEFLARISEAKNLLTETYVNRGLPHSSSPLAKRIEDIRKRDPLEAQAYMFVFLPIQNQYHFDARDISSWRGFLAGISERFDFTSIPKESFNVALISVEQLREKTERLLGEKSVVFEELHRKYEKLATDIADTEIKHKIDFATFLENNQNANQGVLDSHKDKMDNVERVFREEMSLRAPAEYWQDRKKHHDQRSTILGRWTFGSVAGLAVIIGLVAYWVFNNLRYDGKPDTWRVAVLVLLGVLGVWAVRLIARIFFSNMHLATDAGERVTMVKTYLSLLEAEKMPADDDRKIILQALFRPGSDRLVKDEAPPHPVLEAFTRMGR